MEERLSLREREHAALQAARAEHPEQFQRTTHVEDAAMLDTLGIYIPGQEQCPVGYLKLWPQDFIVEEAPAENEQLTVIRTETDTPENTDRLPTLYATLVKAGLSTIEAVEELSRELGIEKTAIQFAGIKDKDAITAQRISIRLADPLRIASYRSPNLFLKDMCYGKGAVERSGLSGNRFHILVRTNEPPQEQDIARRISELSRDGFYNFYYLQRFGTPRLINFYWGYLLLRGEHKETVTHYLTEGTPRELPYIRAVRESLKPLIGNWTAIAHILEELPLMFATELKLIRYLERHPDDFVGALREIPEQITLWIYGFSSWLFNTVLSTHIREGMRIPAALPLFLSKDRADWAPYQDLLRHMNIWPPPFENLRAFPGVQIRKNQVPTRERASIHAFKITSDGVALSFTLSKGSYATTFLAHLFRLASGAPPQDISDRPVDILHMLHGTENSATLEYFQEVLAPKTKNPSDESNG